MGTMNLLFGTTTLIYLLASVFYLVAMVGKRPQAGRIGRWLLLAGVIIHAACFGVRHSTAGGTPVTSLHESFAFFAWCLVLLFLLLDLRFHLSVMGAFAAPLAFLLMIASALSPNVVVQLNPVLKSWLFPVHIIFAFLGNAAFSLSFGAGVMYLIQNRMLKSKRFNGIYKLLPSLDVLDKVNYTCLSVGFPLMTLGIISGAFWANTAWGTYWSWDPKETWALITWFLYAALLHGRLTIGWRGRKAAIFSIIAFMFLLFTFLGVNLLLGGYHTFEAFAVL
ncbi:c-type cytochrome biogenesis protein CcsB [uncultured Desulfuromusa sp.]|uniref:c-type cytochrome biogenesis protein CcsB n=1 Tax=uncultured Desulfuromusa sp. TaxID=219183 RepID=UPI002AA606C0|nr:c-type cytochrome biogenesis protein CcsB [uncultured Desulfuromusa sp.]